VTLVAAGFSAPAARKTWARAGPGRLATGLAVAGVAIAATYGILAGLAAWRAGACRLAGNAGFPEAWWIAVGQSTLAFGEELYYRGLVLHEVYRLAPRLGLRAAGARRWAALLLSSALFSMEHLSGAMDPETVFRETVFSLALGLLFGIVVLLTENLWISAAIHAWINGLLLGVAPRVTVDGGAQAFPPALYIAVALTATVVLAAWIAAARARREG
jgi:membrane protease YdiL (CAAX protease family)